MKKQTNNKNQWDFWLENKTLQHFVLTTDEIKARFLEFIKTKELHWLEYYGTFQLVQVFVGYKKELKGLGSFMEPEDYEPLAELLKDILWDYIDSIKIKF